MTALDWLIAAIAWVVMIALFLGVAFHPEILKGTRHGRHH